MKKFNTLTQHLHTTTPAIVAKVPMPIRRSSGPFRKAVRLLLPALSAACLSLAGSNAQASIAYGSLNNFDCVNDTGFEAHGFDIELDDVTSKDITYTYDWNHYGVPKITEDSTSVPGHTNVLVRYAAVKTNGVWSAYTAIPSGPIAPTQGHQFTDPSVNFGGEHFGVGYYGAPSAVKYNWLIDDGSGNLIHGLPVNVATPTFTYNPPAVGVPANVVAVVAPPPPPAPPVMQFGDASWVKEIKTTTHNTNKVALVELVGDDLGQPQPWANGEPAEVEVEWRILQTEFAAANGGAKGELQGAPEDLPEGNETITRRYEFYKYIGPVDAESGEAVGDAVGAADPDGVHYFGAGTVTYNDHIDPATGEWVTTTLDLSTVWVVGEFFGAQMSGFDVAPNLGLIEHLQDGEVNVAYPGRTVVVAGGTPFQASVTAGALPSGLTLDGITGVLSGTPTAAGVFTFSVEAWDTTQALVSNAYTITITGDVVAPPATYTIATSASPAAGGTTSGDGNFQSGSSVIVTATPNAGYQFMNWSFGGVAVSAAASYQFSINGNCALVANFAPVNVAPVANNQSLAAAEDTDLSVTLTATDVNGDQLAYSVVANPTHGTLSGIAPNLTYHPEVNYNGPDSFTFKANDGQLDGNVATVSIDVSPVNDPPVANAGPPQTVVLRGLAVLDGSASSDIDGNALSYSWTMTSKPSRSKAVLSGADTAHPSFRADREGTYVVSLVVNDGTIASAPSEVTISTTKK
ncbi:MAG TPA: Ig-like domain-containing protein [Candidatus Limnocylindrales bacterium]|jgi:hypothetical protein|nr:Ig-like domain-containing protein [Candidatus Limnocylindrales bacterium]